MSDRSVSVPVDSVPLDNIPAENIVAGSATGPALILDEPLSMWGGLDAETGRIIDPHHPQHGLCVSGAVLVMPFGRGSSSASSVLAEAVRLGTAPVGFVLQERDEIIALGCLVAEEIYGTITPVVVADPRDLGVIQAGATLQITNGSIIVDGMLEP